jgi:hypothetical protein
MAMLVTVLLLDVAFGGEIHKEDEHGGGQSNGRGP